MRRTLPRFYTLDQMIALATQPDRHSFTGIRDRAILGLACATGLRASELCSLTVGDVTPTLVHVQSGKGGHQRMVPLTEASWRAILRYRAIHPAQTHQPLFRTRDGRAFSRHRLYKLVRYYSRRAGLRGAVHTIRHSIATLLVNQGLDLVRVKVLLGHVSLTSTQIYVSTATDELVRQYRRAMQRPAPALAPAA